MSNGRNYRVIDSGLYFILFFFLIFYFYFFSFLFYQNLGLRCDGHISHIMTTVTITVTELYDIEKNIEGF